MIPFFYNQMHDFNGFARLDFKANQILIQLWNIIAHWQLFYSFINRIAFRLFTLNQQEPLKSQPNILTI